MSVSFLLLAAAIRCVFDGTGFPHNTSVGCRRTPPPCHVSSVPAVVIAFPCCLSINMVELRAIVTIPVRRRCDIPIKQHRPNIRMFLPRLLPCIARSSFSPMTRVSHDIFDFIPRLTVIIRSSWLRNMSDTSLSSPFMPAKTSSFILLPPSIRNASLPPGPKHVGYFVCAVVCVTVRNRFRALTNGYPLSSLVLRLLSSCTLVLSIQ